jgi:hypothetical protein
LQVEKEHSGWIEGVAIMVSVVIVVMVTAINDLQKERQFQELQKQQVRSSFHLQLEVDLPQAQPLLVKPSTHRPRRITRSLSLSFATASSSASTLPTWW